jgi:hypothetical protein
MIVSPPTLGGPFDYLNLTICIAGTDICFVHQCSPVTSPTSNCTVTSADCADTATDCLRANTTYTVSTVAVTRDGQTSLPSNTEPFTTAPYLCADRCCAFLLGMLCAPRQKGRCPQLALASAFALRLQGPDCGG